MAGWLAAVADRVRGKAVGKDQLLPAMEALVEHERCTAVW